MFEYFLELVYYVQPVLWMWLDCGLILSVHCDCLLALDVLAYSISVQDLERSLGDKHSVCHRLNRLRDVCLVDRSLLIRIEAADRVQCN